MSHSAALILPWLLLVALPKTQRMTSILLRPSFFAWLTSIVNKDAHKTMESYLLNLAQDSGVLLAGFATIWLIGYLVTDALINKDEDNQ